MYGLELSRIQRYKENVSLCLDAWLFLGIVIWFQGEEKENGVTKRMFLYIWLHGYFMLK